MWEPDRRPAFFIVWRCFPIATTGHQTNEEIRDKEVRLISESGEQLGIMSSQEALRLAEERNLDLVKISPNAVPPVCKLSQDLLLKFAEECGEQAVMDKSPKLEGRHMSIFLSPKPAKDAKK